MLQILPFTHIDLISFIKLKSLAVGSFMGKREKVLSVEKKCFPVQYISICSLSSFICLKLRNNTKHDDLKN